MTEPEQTEDEAFPRSLSMTWGEVCDVEVRMECTISQSLETKTLTGAPTSGRPA